MVEFAIENAQALKKRALRQTRVHEGKAAKPGRGGHPEAGSEAGAPAPGSRQQQRKRRREEPEVLSLMRPWHGPCICLEEHLELESTCEQAGVAITMSVRSKSELKKTAYSFV